MKPGLSELQVEAGELNRSQSVGKSIVIGLSSNSCFRLPTPTIWFWQDHKRRSHKRVQNETETFGFFRLRFWRAYRSAYDHKAWEKALWLVYPPTPASDFRLQQSGFDKIISEEVISGFRMKQRLSDSSDSDSDALIAPLTTPIFDFD